MRRVLDVIPRSVFEILQRIIEVQTTQLRPLPVKFESQYLKEYAQLDERCACALICIYACGMHAHTHPQVNRHLYACTFPFALTPVLSFFCVRTFALVILLKPFSYIPAINIIEKGTRWLR